MKVIAQKKLSASDLLLELREQTDPAMNELTFNDLSSGPVRQVKFELTPAELNEVASFFKEARSKSTHNNH